jgi:hypothetical protein
MITLSRWFAPAVMATGLGLASMMPAPARAQDDTLTRVLVDVADVVLRGGQPYYRHGNYRDDDRLIVGRDRYGRPVYYRVVRVDRGYGNPYYVRNPYDTRYDTARTVKCKKNGDCTVKYYDPRYDRRGYYTHYDGRHYDRRHDDRRRDWRQDDDQD